MGSDRRRDEARRPAAPRDVLAFASAQLAHGMLARMRTLFFRLLAALCCVVPVAAAGTIIGFHDLSDPVKSAGWACDPESVAPLVVHLYAETPAGLRWIDSQRADQFRGDLPFVCNGAGHSFRFADYAANGTAGALYASPGVVAMHVFAEGANGPIPLAGTPRPITFAAVGLRDAGIVDGGWGTDYPNPLEGTLAAPLLLGACAYATPFSEGYPSFSGGGYTQGSACSYDEITFPRSNAAGSEPASNARTPWTVIANVENALHNPLCTNGPPGQSLPVAPPGAGEVFGVVALPDLEAMQPLRRKFHLVLNSQQWAACRNGSYGGPYLAFGAQADRGNDGVIAYLNRPGSPPTLSFGMTLMDIADDVSSIPGAPSDARRYSQAHVLIEALWGGVKRWIFIELVPDIRLSATTRDGTVDAHVRFNWHFADSILYPGAEYLFKSGTVLTAQCADEGVVVPVLDRRATYANPATREQSRHDYRIDLQRVFDCLQRRGEWGRAPMPAHPVPITLVLFGIEQDDRVYRQGGFTGVTAPNAIWIAVDSVRIEQR